MRSLGVALFLTSALVAAPASAQQTTGSRLGADKGRVAQTADKAVAARRTMADTADCVWRERKSDVRDYFATVPGSEAAGKLADRTAIDECLSAGELRFPELGWRGALYESAYRDSFAAPAPGLAQVPTLAHLEGATTPLERQLAGMRDFMDCVVRAAPLEADRLIRTEVATPEEKVALKALLPHLNPCMFDGVTIELTLPTVRSLAAESLYRLSKAAS